MIIFKYIVLSQSVTVNAYLKFVIDASIVITLAVNIIALISMMNK